MPAQRRCRCALGWLLAAWLVPVVCGADTIRVAVASNFKPAMEAIAARFEAATGHEVVAGFGSTGKHYAQIRNGAPFDVFLAADAERPRRLEEAGAAVAGTRFTYAIGRLVLWSPRPGYVDPHGAVLRAGSFRFLAIANPAHAPYGRAAREVLQALGLWDALQRRIVRGENVGQAYQMVHSGNAELGFVARSQIVRPDHAVSGSAWEVPQAWYAPIEQQALVVRDGAGARAFVQFLRRAETLSLLRAYGYDTP